jgi:hypothetical protein
LILRDGHSFTLTAPERDLLVHAGEIVEAQTGPWTTCGAAN